MSEVNQCSRIIAINFGYLVIPLILNHQIVSKDKGEEKVLEYWMERLRRGYVPIKVNNNKYDVPKFYGTNEMRAKL